jgi:hypothetical protein
MQKVCACMYMQSVVFFLGVAMRSILDWYNWFDLIFDWSCSGRHWDGSATLAAPVVVSKTRHSGDETE